MRIRFLQTIAVFMLFATSGFAQFDSKFFDSQRELEPMLEQAQAEPVKGFAYCDRTVTSPLFLSTKKDSMMLSGAILIPPMKDNQIKGVKFYANVADDKGCIFIADAESNEILEIKEVPIKPGLNGFSFDTPLTMKDETSYYVGFQQLAGAGKQSYVIPFDSRREYSLKPGAFVQISKKRYEKSGYAFPMDVSSLHIGTLMIYVDIEDVQNKMVNMAIPLKTEIPEDATEEKPFDAVITLRNLGGNEIKSLNVGLLFGQNSQSGDLSCSIPAYSDGEIKATCEPVVGGLGTCELTIRKVNGAINPFDYKALNQYRVIALAGGGVPRDNVLVEAFVSEKSEKSIEAEKRLMEVCEEYKSQGLNPIFVTYHLDDEFTSRKIKSLTGDLNISEYPVAAFNRLVNPNVEYSLDLSNAQPMEQWEVMKKLAAKADQPFTFDNVTVKKDGSIAVYMTGTTYKYCDPRALCVTALVVEKKVPAKAQVGAKEGYVHHNVVREFITLEYGNKLNPDEQMVEFKSKPISSLENQTKRDLDIVIILHQGITGIYPKQKFVYAAGVWTLNSTIGVEQVAPEHSPKISVLDGYLNIEGDVRDVTIYTVDGQVVAQSVARQLTSGCYVVVFTSHNGYKGSAKVFVK